MDEAKRKRLEAEGWKVGTVQEFLGLTDEEMEEIEERIAKVSSGRPEEDLTEQQDPGD